MMGTIDAANDVFSSLQVFHALAALSPTPLDLDRLSTSISTSGQLASSISQLEARRTPSGVQASSTSGGTKPLATARQREAYGLFCASPNSTASSIGVLLGASTATGAVIQPLSAVWLLLGALDRDPTLAFDDARLLDLVAESFGRSRERMLVEFEELLGAVEGRELERMKRER